jgi:Flp pilus assembly pilin Flp
MLKQFAASESGAVSIEYALIAVLAVATILLVTALSYR